MHKRFLSIAMLAAATATAQDSFYEVSPAGTLDLTGLKLVGTFTGNGYVVTLIPGAGITVPGGAIQLTLSDDNQVDTNTVGGTLGLFVGSNCWMAVGPGTSNGFAPSVPTFLNNPSTGVYSWTDLQPNAAGSGQVYYDEPSPGIGRATYDGVYGWGSTDANTVQIVYDTTTLDFSIEWGAVGALNPEDWLVGFSLGGPSAADPGPTDISAAAPFSIAFPATASVVAQGPGCGAAFASFYEITDAASQDLGGQIVTGTNTGSGYAISVAPGAGVTVPAAAVVVTGISDDNQVDTATIGGTLGFFVGSNCWLALGAGNSNGFIPSATTFLSNPSTGVYAWTDLQPNAAGSGLVYYDEPSAGVGRVTYDGVYGWGTTNGNTVQITFDTVSGDFSIEFGALATTNPENWLVGYSPGGASLDPGATDISFAAPFALAAADVVALQLDAIGTPIQGALATDFQVTTSNIPGSVLSHMGVIGLSRPGTPLDSLGLPGCFLNASGDVLDFVVGVGASGSYTWTALTLPSTATGAFYGFEFNVQAIVFGTNINSFLGLGALTSNGLKCTVGDS